MKFFLHILPTLGIINLCVSNERREDMNYLKPQLLESLADYSKEKFLKDLVSGVIVAIIALPLSIALALASGVTPEQGLYTAIVAGFLISALGGSKVQIAGPTAAFASIVAGTAWTAWRWPR